MERAEFLWVGTVKDAINLWLFRWCSFKQKWVVCCFLEVHV